jgi:hypothetical protein
MLFPWSVCNLVLANSHSKPNKTKKEKNQRNQQGEVDKQTGNKTNKQTSTQKIPGSRTIECQS